MRKAVAVLVILAAAGVIGWLYWEQQRPVPLVVSGFIEADQIRVGSRVGGRVAEVLVDEGDTTEPGESLFRIEPFDLQEQLKQAEAQLAAHQAEHARLTAGFRPEEVEQARAKRDQAAATLEKLVAGPRPQEIQIAREELNRAKAALELAQSEYNRLLKLREEATAARIEFDQAERQLKAARAEVAAAEQRVSLLEEGTRKEDVAAARATLAEAEQALKLMAAGYRQEEIAQAAAQVRAAEANVAAIRVRLGELTVSAPGKCVVEAVDLEPGDIVAQNAPAISLLDLSKLWVRAYVPEDRLGQVAVGTRVPIRVDSFPGERFMARLTFVSRDAEFTPRNVQTPEERSKQVFRIKVYLEEGLDRLRAGMAADVLLDEAAGP